MSEHEFMCEKHGRVFSARAAEVCPYCAEEGWKQLKTENVVLKEVKEPKVFTGLGVKPEANFTKVRDKKSAFDVQIGGGHYKDMVIEPAKFNMANNLGWAEGSVVSYVARWRAKGGIEDLKKAKHTIELLIEHEEGLVSRDT